MRPNIYQIRAAWLSFFLLSAGIAHAATPIILLPDSIPLFQWLFAFALSFLGGAANSIQRWAKANEGGNIYLLLGRDFICSISAGMVTFFAAIHYEPPSALAVIGIFIAGYGGSRALDFLYNKSESFLGRKIDREVENESKY